MLLPLHLLLTAALGLVSLIIFIAAIALLYRAFLKGRRRHYILKANEPRGIRRPKTGLAAAAGSGAVALPLGLGFLLLLFTFAGRHIVELAYPASGDEPALARGGSPQTIEGYAGSKLHVESYGRADAPVLVFTHGWSMDNSEWYYAKRDLSNDFRLVVWDLPGLGESTETRNGDYAVETLARNLHAVIAAANGKPVILVGHSIGTMINLTLCKLYPEMQGREIAGIVQLDGTYTNPVRTTKNSELSQKLQKPVAEPILHAMIVLSPLVHMMNWFSYQNGITHLVNAKSAFAGAETRGQLDLISRLQAQASPAVVARGTLGMFHWDGTQALPRVTVPALILVGKEDTTTLPSASAYMREHMPQAELQEFSPAAHYALLEQHEPVDSAIRAWCQKHLPR